MKLEPQVNPYFPACPNLGAYSAFSSFFPANHSPQESLRRKIYAGVAGPGLRPEGIQIKVKGKAVERLAGEIFVFQSLGGVEGLGVRIELGVVTSHNWLHKWHWGLPFMGRTDAYPALRRQFPHFSIQPWPSWYRKE